MAYSDPYPVKAAICWSGNPMVWAPNTKMVYEGLKNLELFVVLEYFKTPTAALADYIFPAADWMERPMCTTVEDSADIFAGCARAVKPHEDRRMDYDFFRALGMRLGQENDWPWETYEDVIAHRVGRVGVSYEEFTENGMLFPDMRFNKQEEIRPDGQLRGYATPSRRLEIYPSIFEELGYDPLPSYKELPETPNSNPELAKEFPIILTTGGRWSPMFHSEHRVPGTGTREMFPWPIFQIHLETARDLGIRDGDWCWIESPRGRIKQRARLGFDVAPGTIIAQPSWWYPEMPAEEPWLCGAWESNVNVLTDDSPENLDPACGNWVNRGLLCRVYRCEEPEWLSDKIPTDMFLSGNAPYSGVSNRNRNKK
jgi:anaerobic selenocysteine-containing dehydrogenase